MTKQEIQKKIKELQSKINEMQDKLEELKRVATEKDNPFQRRAIEEKYFYIQATGGTAYDIENDYVSDRRFYAAANYCADENIIKKRAAEETLSRLIWREAEIANAGREDEGRYRYVIDYNASLKTVIYYQVSWHLESPGRAGFIHIDDVRACVKDVVIPFVKSCPELGWELKEEEKK